MFHALVFGGVGGGVMWRKSSSHSLTLGMWILILFFWVCLLSWSHSIKRGYVNFGLTSGWIFIFILFLNISFLSTCFWGIIDYYYYYYYFIAHKCLENNKQHPKFKYTFKRKLLWHPSLTKQPHGILVKRVEFQSG